MRSLSLKLILAFLVVGLTGVGLVAVVTSRTTANEFDRFVFDQNREILVTQLTEYYSAHGTWTGVQEALPLPELTVPKPHAFGKGGPITLIDGMGKVIVEGPGFSVGDQVSPTDAAQAVPIDVDGQEVGRLLVERSAFRGSRSEAAFLDRANQTLLVSAIGSIAVALILGIFLARTLIRPLRQLIAATRTIAEGDLEQKIHVRSRDELGELASSFNKMSEELARSRNLRRQMTADIAHELRTPISVIIGHVDGVANGVIPDSSETFSIIQEEAGRLERLVEDLRTLSMADAGELTLTLRLVSPQTVLEQASAAYRPHANEKRITLRVEAEPDLPEIYVDPDRMAQVFGNLISNALYHTPTDGHITLSALRVSDEVEIRVQDSGPGIEPEELHRVFNRFYRTDKSRQRDSGGSGLGLAIAKSIVENHGGRIWAESAPGEGTIIAIALPKINVKKLS